MSMETATYKTSTIFVSTGERTRVFRSIEDVPLSLRKRLTENIAGPNSRTLIVADRRGREYLFRALKRAGKQAATTKEFSQPKRKRFSLQGWRGFSLEFGLLSILGVAGWALVYWK